MAIENNVSGKKISRVSLSIMIACLLGVGMLPPIFSLVPADPLDGAIFMDPSVPVDARVEDLLSRLTIKEKILMLTDTDPGVPRLGLKPHYHGNEALHGIVRPGQFTVYPQAIALAATFDPEAIHVMASQASNESRALFNAQGGIPQSPYCGMVTFFSPNVNMARDPRWGRTPETYGEDPWLTSRMAVAFVKGLQGTPYDEPRNYSVPIKAVATPKHYVANNEESWDTGNGTWRNRVSLSAEVPEKWLREYYFSGFKAAITEANAECIMSAYNALNGTPCSANHWLLTEVLRDEWGHQGYVVTDCGAAGLIRDGHHYVATKAEAVAAAIKAGVDVECGSDFKPYLLQALDLKLLTVGDINNAARRVLRSRFRLGLYDPTWMDPYASLATGIIGCDAHASHSLELAEKSMVLLKNDHVNGTRLLPVNTTAVSSIAVLGPGADVVQFGDYSGWPVRAPVTPLAGLITRAAGVNSSGGSLAITHVQWNGSRNFESEPDDDILFHDELLAADTADMVVAVVSLGTGEEREGIDRTTLALTPTQVRFLQAVGAKNPRLVVVLVCGSSVSMEGWGPATPAILNAWYGGESAGTAIARLLFGDVSPSGRLPLTFYTSETQLPPFYDYDISHNRTYMFLEDEPLFPFGFGLSYTTFNYTGMVLNKTTFAAQSNETVGVTVHVDNTGSMTGDEIVQIYVRRVNATGQGWPALQLKGFRRVSVPAGTSVAIHVPVKFSQLAIWNQDVDAWHIEPGTYEIVAGSSAKDLRVASSITIT